LEEAQDKLRLPGRIITVQPFELSAALATASRFR